METVKRLVIASGSTGRENGWIGIFQGIARQCQKNSVWYCRGSHTALST